MSKNDGKRFGMMGKVMHLMMRATISLIVRRFSESLSSRVHDESIDDRCVMSADM